MKKLFRRKGNEGAPQVEIDVAGLMDSIQEQLASLERKLDILIGQSQAKPAFQRFDRHHHDRGRQGNGFRERSYTKVICADCGNECEVPFKPSAGRPVYCNECFAKRKEGGSFKGNYENRHGGGNFSEERSFDRQDGRDNRKSRRKHKPSLRKRRGRD